MLTQVADGVWVRQSAWMASNAIVVRGADGLTVVDPGIDGSDLDELADDVDALGAPVVAGLATHPHWDHLLWHSRLGDVPRYATPACAALADEARERAQAMAAQSAEGIPMELVALLTPLPGVGAPVPGELIVHDAHAVGHLAVLLADRRVLIAGDMLSDLLIPILDGRRPGQVAAYDAALDLLAHAARDVDVLIPGHGTVAEGPEVAARLAADRAYLEALRRGEDPVDARLGPDWVKGIHTANQEQARPMTRAPRATSVARRLYELTEPIALVNFFSPEPNDAMAALGFTNYWDGYFAGRSAPLGPVPAEVVDAAFYNFAEGEVARHIPKVWATTTPEAAHAARAQGCTAALRTILGDLADSPGLARTAELLAQASVGAPVQGRVMYAGLRALGMPEEPVSRLWHAANMLREHRGDGHIVALVSEQVGGLEAHVLSALDSDILPAESFGRIHHLPKARLAELMAGLRDRGLVDAAGRFTDAGRATKDRVEALTDALAEAPYDALAPAELEELTALLGPIAQRLSAVGSNSEDAG